MPNTKGTLQNCTKTLKFYQSGEILPSLVTVGKCFLTSDVMTILLRHLHHIVKKSIFPLKYEIFGIRNCVKLEIDN